MAQPALGATCPVLAIYVLGNTSMTIALPLLPRHVALPGPQRWVQGVQLSDTSLSALQSGRSLQPGLWKRLLELAALVLAS